MRFQFRPCASIHLNAAGTSFPFSIAEVPSTSPHLFAFNTAQGLPSPSNGRPVTEKLGLACLLRFHFNRGCRSPAYWRGGRLSSFLHKRCARIVCADRSPHIALSTLPCLGPLASRHFLFGVPVQDHHTQGVCCGLALSQKETPGSLRVPRVRGSLFSARLLIGAAGGRRGRRDAAQSASTFELVLSLRKISDTLVCDALKRRARPPFSVGGPRGSGHSPHHTT